MHDGGRVHEVPAHGRQQVERIASTEHSQQRDRAGRARPAAGVIGGMLAAAFPAILFVRLFYVLIQKARERLAGKKA